MFDLVLAAERMLISEAPAEPGVYILMHKAKIFYVGQSKNICKRMSQHRAQDGGSIVYSSLGGITEEFMSLLVFSQQDCEVATGYRGKKARLMIEGHLILKLCPSINKRKNQHSISDCQRAITPRRRNGGLYLFIQKDIDAQIIDRVNSLF